MALNSLFKRLLSSQQEPQKLSVDALAKRLAATPAPGKQSLQQSAPRAILHRDEIIDSRTRIAGYRFYVPALHSTARPAHGTFIDALKAEAVLSFAKRRMALIPISAQEWRATDYRQFIAPNTLFLLTVPGENEAIAEASACIAEIKSAGARVGVQGVTADAQSACLLALCDLALIDFNDYSLTNLERVIGIMRAEYPKVALSVDNVPAWPERRLCVAHGVEYCLGGFTAEIDAESESDQLNQSHLLLIEMLNLLRREADLSELTVVAKRDPAIALHILSMANSPIAGLSKSVGSLEQAVMVLGREHLYRWISISMFRLGSNRARDESLLELALTRARFLELVGHIAKSKREADELFLVGLLSMLDCLLGMPMPKILARLALPKPVEDVLLRSDGEYARYLMLAIAVERGRTESWTKTAQSLHISPEQIEKASMSALAWAEDAMRAPGSSA